MLKWKKDFVIFEGYLMGLIVLSALFLLIVLGGLFVGWIGIGANFFVNLLGGVLISYILGGQLFLVDRLRDSWYEAKGNDLVIQFFKQPQNKYIYLKLEFDEGDSYDEDQLRSFFKTAHYSSLFREYTIERRLNYGIGSYEICFDIIVDKGKVECYLAVSLVLKEGIVKALVENIPTIKIKDCENPYSDMPRQWNDQTGVGEYNCMTGTSLGFQLSNYLTSIPISQNTNTNYPVDTLLDTIKTNFDKEKIILQYVLTFDNNHATSLFAKELGDLRQVIYDRFSLKFSDEEVDEYIVHAFLPNLERVRLEEMEKKLLPSNRFISTNIKLIAFCQKEDYINLEERLEKILRSYSGQTTFYRNNNRIDKIFFTSSSQRYYNIEGKNQHPGLSYIYDTFWFPPSWLEPLLSTVYDNVYYFNENRYRRQVIYRRTLRRSGQGPWLNKNTTLDFNSLTGVIQIPTIR